jgi:PKD repeat protein
VDEFTVVDIGITPLGTDFGNSTTRFASLRLVPRGVVVPPSGLQPAFTFTPGSPTANQNVLFDASTSRSPANNPIVSYSWDFGDRTTGSNVATSHAYASAGTYVVTLTVTDAAGRTAQTSQSITVAPGANPTARFTFSPTEPLPGQQVNFNAASSVAAPGRQIVSYEWDFGDGGTGSGVRTSRTYTVAGIYTITLTVRDDVGRTNTTSQTVPVKVPDPDEGG